MFQPVTPFLRLSYRPWNSYGPLQEISKWASEITTHKPYGLVCPVSCYNCATVGRKVERKLKLDDQYRPASEAQRYRTCSFLGTQISPFKTETSRNFLKSDGDVSKCTCINSACMHTHMILLARLCERS